MSLKRRVGFNATMGLDPLYPQRGPYEASEGIDPETQARKNWVLGGQD
jgi:hypothetical protein